MTRNIEVFCGANFVCKKFSEANCNSVEDCVLHQEKSPGPALSNNNNNNNNDNNGFNLPV